MSDTKIIIAIGLFVLAIALILAISVGIDRQTNAALMSDCLAAGHTPGDCAQAIYK